MANIVGPDVPVKIYDYQPNKLKIEILTFEIDQLLPNGNKYNLELSYGVSN